MPRGVAAVPPDKLKGQVRALIPMLISQTDKPMTSIFNGCSDGPFWFTQFVPVIVRIAADSPLTFGLAPGVIIGGPEGIRSCNSTRQIPWKNMGWQKKQRPATPQRSLRACTHG